MNDPHDLADEALGRLLEMRPGGEPDAELRRTLRGRTMRVVRGRRRLRRAALAASLVACYLAGIATVRPVSTRLNSSATTVAQSMPVPDDRPGAATAAESDIDVRLSPGTVERLAETAGEQRPRYYRTAGSRYEATGDMASAVRCYAQYLDAADAQDLSISAEEDSFLLMAMKADRRKDKDNERVHD